jgi:hypothetical protein
MGATGEEKRLPSSGDVPPHRSAVFERAHLCSDSLDLLRHDFQGSVSNVSVDAIKQPAAGFPGEKIGIRFQGCGNPGRRGPCRRIPELEVAQDLFDERSVFDEADDP